MEDEDQMIMDNIDEFVNDENKIVSYKWLSLSLSLHINKATRLLEEYLKKSDNELDVIYFVGGRKKEGLYTTFQYKLAKQNTLDNVKGTFDEVTTCHIYSIQKSCIKDADLLYDTNHIDIFDEFLPQMNKCSAIQCDSVKNFDETLEKRRQHDVPVLNSFHEINNIKTKENEEEVLKPQPAKDVTKSQLDINKKGKQSSKKETTTKSFFGKKSSVKKPDPDVLEQEDISKQDKLPEIPENKSIDAKNAEKAKVENKDIFTSFAKSKKKDLPKEVDPPIKSVTIKSDSETEDIQKEEEKDVIKSKSKSKKSVTKSKKEKITTSPCSSPVKEETDVASAPIEVEKIKKRKAPVVDSESDDDDFEKFLTKSKDPTYKSPEKKQSKPKKSMDLSDEDEIDVIEPTPEPVKKKKRRKTEKDELKKKSGKVEAASLSTELKVLKHEDSKEVDQDKNNVENNSTDGKRRGRRMVIKSKQYLDEDGFMVTRKEREIESFSEESDTEMSEEKVKLLSPEKKKEVEKKKIIIDLEKKTKVHLTKPKTQASLMNFFKKK